MPKKTWTEEERKAFGEKMKKLREEKMTGVHPPINAEKTKEVHTLDLTKVEVRDEGDLFNRIRSYFDEGKNPQFIRINSRLALDSFRWSSIDRGNVYSPYGGHKLVIVPQKELDNEETV